MLFHENRSLQKLLDGGFTSSEGLGCVRQGEDLWIWWVTRETLTNTRRGRLHAPQMSSGSCFSVIHTWLWSSLTLHIHVELLHILGTGSLRPMMQHTGKILRRRTWERWGTYMPTTQPLFIYLLIYSLNFAKLHISGALQMSPFLIWHSAWTWFNS